MRYQSRTEHEVEKLWGEAGLSNMLCALANVLEQDAKEVENISSSYMASESTIELALRFDGEVRQKRELVAYLRKWVEEYK